MEKVKGILAQAPEGQKWSGQFNPETRRVDFCLVEKDDPNLDEIRSSLDQIDAKSADKVKNELLGTETRRKQIARKIFDKDGVLVLSDFSQMNWNNRS